MKMPIDYKKYPPNWKTEIRPRIMERSKNKCEFCGIKNYSIVLRGEYMGLEVYQEFDYGMIYNADNSVQIASDYVGEVHPTNKAIKIVLTVAHLDHDISNNKLENLRALCQRCHNRYDVAHRTENRKKSKKQLGLF